MDFGYVLDELLEPGGGSLVVQDRKIISGDGGYKGFKRSEGQSVEQADYHYKLWP